MKIKQLLMLLVAGVFGLSAADDEQFVSDNEDASYSQQADVQEGLQGSDMQEYSADNPYLGEGFSPAESMQEQNNDDVEMTPSYDGGQSSGEFESAPEAAPEDMPESELNSYGYDGGQSSGEFESAPEAAPEDMSESALDYSGAEENTSEGLSNESAFSEQVSSAQDENYQREDIVDEWASSNN